MRHAVHVVPAVWVSVFLENTHLGGLIQLSVVLKRGNEDLIVPVPVNFVDFFAFSCEFSFHLEFIFGNPATFGISQLAVQIWSLDKFDRAASPEINIWRTNYQIVCAKYRSCYFVFFIVVL